tara:strand:- start:574 stop:2160 length:1587 start_codon:yes stop_codon:yes gene_type:complete
MALENFFFILMFTVTSLLFSQNPLDNYLIGNNNLTVIGSFQNGVEKPRDLDFHPTISNQLWVLNKGEDAYANNSENITSICVPENSELTFIIYDSDGDGICCESGEGSYSVSACENIYVTGGDFENSESTSFNVSDNCDNSCPFGEVELDIIINTDNWAKETSWILSESNSEIVYARRLEPGGSTVIFHDAGLNNQTSEYRKDSYSRHFMHTASSLAFDDEGFFANTLECQDANNNSGFFSGPTLWDSDLSIYAEMNQDGPLLGSHLDMIHQSPYSMGIEYAGVGNVYWVFDGYHSSIVRYDFAMPHEIGGHDHSDGKVWRYDEVDIAREEGVPSHMILDDELGLLYIADTGNQRILKFNVNSGNYSYDLTPYGESLAEYFMMENADWEIYINQGLDKPSGIDMYNDRLVISDYASGDIIFYDISISPPVELGRIDTGIQNNIMGIKIDSNQKIWYVNYKDNNVIRIDYSLIHGDINSDGDVNVNDVVTLVNYILNFGDSESIIYDINDDDNVNVIDVVQLVHIILNN